MKLLVVMEICPFLESIEKNKWMGVKVRKIKHESLFNFLRIKGLLVASRWTRENQQ